MYQDYRMRQREETTERLAGSKEVKKNSLRFEAALFKPGQTNQINTHPANSFKS